ncbi:hypothetical protein COJ07_13615 [Bacillus cereus]|uniref:Uncharacterized protein n=1 Tax=Bacillus cereus TaxID=1396 RepID=A0A2B0TV52_BACCE|nr:hypothetical protein COJ07_13615 [Bacillus cereus]PFU45308.1 hypothetical protein COK86_06715 [Bacillus cereus]
MYTCFNFLVTVSFCKLKMHAKMKLLPYSHWQIDIDMTCITIGLKVFLFGSEFIIFRKEVQT